MADRIVERGTAPAAAAFGDHADDHRAASNTGEGRLFAVIALGAKKAIALVLPR